MVRGFKGGGVQGSRLDGPRVARESRRDMFRTFVAALGIGVMASLVACSPEGGPGAPQAEKQLLKTV